MTLSQLHYLIAVDNHRHFAKAAEASFVTQPTLSMQIQKLEEELGALLFDRSKYPVKPTVVGKRVIAQARVVVQESKRVQEILHEFKNVVEGPFKLGVIPTVATTIVPRFIEEFQKRFPDIQLQVMELQTDQILAQLRNDQLDAGILATPLKENGIIEKPLFYEPFVAFIPHTHPLSDEKFITNSELPVKDMLLLNEGHCFRNSVLNLCNQSSPDNSKAIKMESGNFETLLRLSKKGFGMTLLPYLHAIDLPDADQQYIKPIADPRPTREISIIYTRAELKIKVIEALTEIIKEKVPPKLLEAHETVLSPRLNS